MSATIAYTYDIVTPESAEQGDVSEAGFCDFGGWEYPNGVPHIELDQKQHPELYWVPVGPGDKQRSIGDGIEAARSWCCTENNGDGSFYSVQPDPNYLTGESTTRAVHFNGFTPSTLGRIARLIAA